MLKNFILSKLFGLKSGGIKATQHQFPTQKFKLPSAKHMEAARINITVQNIISDLICWIIFTFCYFLYNCFHLFTKNLSAKVKNFHKNISQTKHFIQLVTIWIFEANCWIARSGLNLLWSSNSLLYLWKCSTTNLQRSRQQRNNLVTKLLLNLFYIKEFIILFARQT